MKFLGARPQHEDLKLLVEDSDAVEGNLAKFDSSGNPVDSGVKPVDLALKDSDAVAGNLAKFDSSGNPVDSGVKPVDLALKDSDAVENNLAKFDSSGNPVDSGIAISDVSKNLYIVENPQTGTTYTLVLTDGHKLVSCANNDPITLTIPLNSNVAFPIGTQILIVQKGTGQITIVGDSNGTSVTVLSAGSVDTTVEQYSMAGLIKVDTDDWILFGDLE